ncbi:hypothetical protein [Comamonas sp. JUb58]|uniref:hypothetical protein n=1 Tax=Comamonas sp. JUb58 TaxID=2485114 RepID=UPI0010609C40|nr:hypothetical protein [Comamonas sp. JUb58]TDS74388.1 hypothetical protein EDF71_11768 [Comamonas sp. JUb58]
MNAVIEVRLEDCPADLDPALKQKAEDRFSKELRRCFPSEQALKQAFKLFMDASEGGHISKSDEKIAITWKNAFDKARQAGFRDIAVEEAYFDVRMS